MYSILCQMWATAEFELFPKLTETVIFKPAHKFLLV